MLTSKKSNSVLTTLLFGAQTTHPKGRVIKFDENIPDIKLSTGTLKQRVIAALEHSMHPMTSKEIADSIGTSQPRASSKIRQLIADGSITEVKLDGCVAEYMLASDSI